MIEIKIIDKKNTAINDSGDSNYYCIASQDTDILAYLGLSIEDDFRINSICFNSDSDQLILDGLIKATVNYAHRNNVSEVITKDPETCDYLCDNHITISNNCFSVKEFIFKCTCGDHNGNI